MSRLALGLLSLLSACRFTYAELAPFPCGMGGACPDALSCHAGQCVTSCPSTGCLSAVTGSTGTTGASGTTGVVTLADTDIGALPGIFHNQIAVDTDNVYWLTYTYEKDGTSFVWQVAKVAKSGGTKQQLFTGTQTLSSAYTGDLEGPWIAGSKIYWWNGANDTIYRGNVTGGAVETVATAVGYLRDLTVSGDTIYWVDSNLASCPASGCAGAAPTTVSMSPGPYEVAIAGNRVFWTSYGQYQALTTFTVLSCTLPACNDSATIGTFECFSGYGRGFFADSLGVFSFAYSGLASGVYQNPKLVRCTLSGGCSTLSASVTRVMAGVSDGTNAYFGDDKAFYSAVAPSWAATKLAGVSSMDIAVDMAMDATTVYFSAGDTIAKFPRPAASGAQ